MARQEALLGTLIQKLQRGAGLVSVDSGKLQDVRQRLSSSLKDKVCWHGPLGAASCVQQQLLFCMDACYELPPTVFDTHVQAQNVLWSPAGTLNCCGCCCPACLHHDVLMQLSALKVDKAVLDVSASQEGTVVANKAPTVHHRSPVTSSKDAAGGDSSSLYKSATLGAAKASCGGLYPSRWQKQANQLVAEAQQLAVDSNR